MLKITLRAELAKAKNWVDLLPSLQFSTMVAYHQSIGTTPFEMVYGEPAMIPYDILFNPHHKLEKNTERKNLQQEEYISQLKQQIRQAHEFANQTQIEAAKIMKDTYDAKSRPAKPLIVGKQVYLYQPKVGKKGESRKLIPNWTGPYLVVEFIPPNNVLIQDPSTGNRQRVHVLRIAEYLPRTEVIERRFPILEPEIKSRIGQIPTISTSANLPDITEGPKLIVWQDPSTMRADPTGFFIGQSLPVTPEDIQSDIIPVHLWSSSHLTQPISQRKFAPHYAIFNRQRWQHKNTFRPGPGDEAWHMSIPNQNIIYKDLQLTPKKLLPNQFLTMVPSLLKAESELLQLPEWQPAETA